MSDLRLNLGANNRRFPGFVSVDIAPPADQLVDLGGPWPWKDSSVSEVLAYDVFEHIGPCDHVSKWQCLRCAEWRYYGLDAKGFVLPVRHWAAKVHVMNELWRVLVPGGKATLQIPHANLGDGGDCDPTHVSKWTTSDFEYYTPGIAERERFRPDQTYYGVKADFRVTNLTQPGSKQCVPCADRMFGIGVEATKPGCKGGHIPTQRFARTYGGYVVEMQIVLEALKP